MVTSVHDRRGEEFICKPGREDVRDKLGKDVGEMAVLFLPSNRVLPLSHACKRCEEKAHHAIT
jgi:hypothetical protein